MHQKVNLNLYGVRQMNTELSENELKIISDMTDKLVESENELKIISDMTDKLVELKLQHHSYTDVSKLSEEIFSKILKQYNEIKGVNNE